MTLIHLSGVKYYIFFQREILRTVLIYQSNHSELVDGHNRTSDTSTFQLPEDTFQVTPYSLNGIFLDIKNFFAERRTRDLFRPQVEHRALKNINYYKISCEKRFDIVISESSSREHSSVSFYDENAKNALTRSASAAINIMMRRQGMS